MKETLTRAQIWTMPLLVGFFSLLGLLAALVADGWGDGISWAALSFPLVVIIWQIVRNLLF